MQFVITFPIDPDRYRRDVNQAIEHALLAVAQTWQREYQPRHFQAGAARRYGYKPRDRYYRFKKFVKFGHNRPLVYTGQSERKAGIARITASSRRSTVRHSYLPRYFFQTRGDGPDKYEELTTVTPAELNELSAVAARVFGQRLLAGRTKTVTRRAA